MQTTTSTPRAAATSSTTPTTVWGRFLDAVLPASSPDRLVRVATVSRSALPLTEGSLADVNIVHVVQEVTRPTGDSRFIVLVSARDSEVASEVLAGF
jgi:hypothetical protein